VVVCLLLAWTSLGYRSHLQRESLVKFDEVTRARDDLEHLSGKLLKVQEEERRRLSRELHDGIGQTLTALRMEIHQAHLNAATGTASSERLMRARMLAEEAVHTIKDISLLLRPPLLDDLGLEPAIAWQADQFTRRTGIPCRFRATGLQEMLPDDVKTCVFRVIQEALNNCQKHASPTKVQILIEQQTETLCVQVEDDGAGFVLKEKHVRHSGLGILGMRERASMLGGSVAIQSAPGKGTRLTLSLPLAKMTATTTRQIDSAVSVPAIGAGERA
jgi:signal transduction histidine kinase